MRGVAPLFLMKTDRFVASSKLRMPSSGLRAHTLACKPYRPAGARARIAKFLREFSARSRPCFMQKALRTTTRLRARSAIIAVIAQFWVLGGCASEPNPAKKGEAEVVLRWGGDPVKYKVQQRIYAEGFLRAHEGSYALFIQSGRGGNADVYCISLTDLSNEESLFLSNKSSHEKKPRYFAISGVIVSSSSPFRLGSVRDGGIKCEVSVSVDGITGLKEFSQ